jgi:hypothetical protein
MQIRVIQISSVVETRQRHRAALEALEKVGQLVKQVLPRLHDCARGRTARHVECRHNDALVTTKSSFARISKSCLTACLSITTYGYTLQDVELCRLMVC